MMMLKKLTLVFSIVLCGFFSFSQDTPKKSDSLVTDYTNTLSAGDRQQLEHKLTAFADSTSVQIAIVIMHTIGQNDIDDYALKLAKQWGIGDKEKNNGVLIFVALDDHKVSIQTGFGAEGPVTDASAHAIIQTDIVPHFKQQDYFGGLDAATSDLMKDMNTTLNEANRVPQQEDNNDWVGYAIVILIVIIVVIVIFRNRGGGGQIYGGRGGASPFWWFLGGTLWGSGGGGWGGFSNGTGGFGNSGGSSDNGGGGGDFGGFGGGDFGGGGSSGSW